MNEPNQQSPELKRRNRIVAIGLVVWIVILFFVSLVKLQGAV